MSYSLDDYRLLDRNGDGQANDPKPLSERRALVDLIRRTAPDILILQDMGSPAVFEEFCTALSGTGCLLPHTEYLPTRETGRHLALLSRHPIRLHQSRTNETYRIGTNEWPVLRGFLDVEIELPCAVRLRILAAHLKSKTFHPAGQTEMRRNEARLLGGIVRQALRDNPSIRLLVAGSLNDSQDSAPVREVCEGLTDLRPSDDGGAAWTWHDREQDAWLRTEYLMASPALLSDWVTGKTRAVDDAAAAIGSSHRPLVAVFRISAGPSAPPSSK